MKLNGNSNAISLIDAGNGIKTENAGWNFKNIPESRFNEHIKCSIPFYEQGHDLICQLSDYFIQHESIAYDIGCSNGVLLEKLALHNKNKGMFVGIDHIQDMIDKATRRTLHLPNVQFEFNDVIKYSFKKADFIVSYYCIQFIPVKHRQYLIQKIYNSLNPGAAFIWFEKVLADHPRIQDWFSIVYNFGFKHENGFSDEEIASKIKSLKGVLVPNTHHENMVLLKNAGFQQITPLMKYLSFEGVLAIK